MLKFSAMLTLLCWNNKLLESWPCELPTGAFGGWFSRRWSYRSKYSGIYDWRGCNKWLGGSIFILKWYINSRQAAPTEFTHAYHNAFCQPLRIRCQLKRRNLARLLRPSGWRKQRLSLQCKQLKMLAVCRCNISQTHHRHTSYSRRHYVSRRFL